jgi:hypothetical protein
MSFKVVIIISVIGWLNACASVGDAGRAYFRQGNKVKGVEPADALIERMGKDQTLRDIVYGQVKSAKVVQCTLLRNQLYVASITGSRSKEVIDAVRLMEAAYQENDAAFLSACDQILSTQLGKLFVSIQQDYLIMKKINL